MSFANTGKEEEKTLQFVRECGQRWQVPIVWIEYRDDDTGFAVVDFDSAARKGEPFEALIRKKSYLPNPVTRFCTSELKIRVMHKFLRSLGLSTEDSPVDIYDGRHSRRRTLSRFKDTGKRQYKRKQARMDGDAVGRCGRGCKRSAGVLGGSRLQSGPAYLQGAHTVRQL